MCGVSLSTSRPLAKGLKFSKQMSLGEFYGGLFLF